MKNIILAFFFCFQFSISWAQSYQCLQAGVQNYFTNSSGYLRGIRIDSVRTMGSDSVYYPYHTPRGGYAASITISMDSTGGSWLGKKVIQRADGTWLFDDLWSDTVFIKTQAHTGDSWIFIRDRTGFSYKATVTSVDTMTVLGFLDSVKKITVKNDSGATMFPPDSTYSFQIILSKNHGFVQIFDLYTFPYHVPKCNILPSLAWWIRFFSK